MQPTARFGAVIMLLSAAALDVTSGPRREDSSPRSRRPDRESVPSVDAKVGTATEDCNANNIPDEDDLANGTSADCNENARPDECDISDGTSSDVNQDFVPDECCLPSSPAIPEFHDQNASSAVVLVPNIKNRYLSFAVGDPGRFQAIRIRFAVMPASWATWNGVTMWVTEPQVVCELAGVGPNDPCPSSAATFLLAGLSCDLTDAHVADWTLLDTVHVTHEGVAPGGFYDAQVLDTTCDPANEMSYSTPLRLQTARWGDVNGPYDVRGGYYTVSDGSVSICTDTTGALNTFGNRPGSMQKARVDIEPAAVDQRINITDVSRILDAFRGLPFPFPPGPRPCGG